MEICQYCKNEFNSKYVLKSHQKRAKYCIKLQKDKNLDIEDEIITCEYCKKKYSTNNFKRHSECCKIKIKILQNEKEKKYETLLKEKDEEILALKNEIIELKTSNFIYKEYAETVKEIAKEPRTTNNNTVHNHLLENEPLVLTQEKVRENIEQHYTREHFLMGQKGAARFAAEYLLKDDNGNLLYICADSSRHIFKCKNENGDIIKDIKANKLIEMISCNLVTRSLEIGKARIQEETENINIVSEAVCKLWDEIFGIKSDSKVFCSELILHTVF